jgi:hypothetical protein
MVGSEKQTYVAEVDGIAIVAFRAVDDSDARTLVDDDLRFFGQLNFAHPDGSPLWDGISPIAIRLADPSERGSRNQY